MSETLPQQENTEENIFRIRQTLQLDVMKYMGAGDDKKAIDWIRTNGQSYAGVFQEILAEHPHLAEDFEYHREDLIKELAERLQGITSQAA